MPRAIESTSCGRAVARLTDLGWGGVLREQLVGDGRVGGTCGEQLAQHPTPAEVGEASDCAAGLGAVVDRDLALRLDPKALGARGPLGARLDLDADLVEGAGRRLRGAGVDAGGEPRPHAVVAPAARRRGGVVEVALQHLHATRGVVLVGQHRLLLGLPCRRDALVALAVVRPRLAGGDPSSLHAAHGTVDVEHLEQQLERRAAQVDPRLEGGRRERHLAQLADDGGRALLAGHRRRREVRPDVLVLASGQQQDVGVVGGAAGTSDLLVVGDR
jgi:hypothetical protein